MKSLVSFIMVGIIFISGVVALNIGYDSNLPKVVIEQDNLISTDLTYNYIFWAERGTVSSANYWAWGNGQSPLGSAVMVNGTVTRFSVECDGISGATSLTMSIHKNGVDTTCDLTVGTTADLTYSTDCDVDFNDEDILGFYANVETGTYTECVGSVLYEVSVGSVSGLKGDKGDKGEDGVSLWENYSAVVITPTLSTQGIRVEALSYLPDIYPLVDSTHSLGNYYNRWSYGYYDQILTNGLNIDASTGYTWRAMPYYLSGDLEFDRLSGSGIYYFYDANMYLQYNISADTVTDRSSVFDKTLGSSLDYVHDASDLLTNGKVDDTKLYDFEKAELGEVVVNRVLNSTNDVISRETANVTGRDLGAVVGKHEQNIYDLIQEIEFLKTELCKKDSSYKFCLGVV